MTALGAVEALLSAMRADLRRGDYAKFETYSVELEASLAGLEALPKDQLLRIRRAAEGNAACLAAAMEGMRSARRRLGDIASAGRGEAYDAKGRRHALGGTDRRLPIASNAADFGGMDQERINPRRV